MRGWPTGQIETHDGIHGNGVPSVRLHDFAHFGVDTGPNLTLLDI